MNLEHLSASRIKTFEQCQGKYHATYELKLKDEPHPLTVMGSACHETYEAGVKAIMAGKDFDWNRQTMLQCRDLKVETEHWDLAVELVQNGIDWGVLRNIKHTVECEREAEFFLPDADKTKVRGFIDRLDIKGNHADILDYKTQKREFVDQELSLNWQARIYNISVRKDFPEIEKVTVSFWVLRHRVQRVVMTAQNAQDDIQSLVEVARQIRAVESPSYCPSALCPWCPYVKQCTAKKQGITKRFNQKWNK